MNFAEYLTNFLAENDLSTSQAAKKIGIDRTLLFRYTTGKRTPQSEEQVAQIADRLCMSPKEKDELIDCFDRHIFGDELVSSYHYVNRLMQILSNAGMFNNQDAPHLTNESYSNDYILSKKSVYLTSPTAIESCAFHIFQTGKSIDGSGCVKIIMQPAYRQIEQMLTTLFSGSDTKIEQIICLEKTIEKGYTNLDILKELITPIFCLNDINVYYHYDLIKSHMNKTRLSPNMILTDNYVLLFDFDMQNGYFSQDTELIKCLDNKFNEIKSLCSQLIEKGTYANIVRENNMVIKTNRLDTFFNQPCVVPCFGSKTLDELIVNFPLKQMLIDSLIAVHGDWNGLEHTEPFSYSNCYCTKEGIIEIFRTSKLDEFPVEFYLPFTKEMKITVLERMIYLHKNNYHVYKVLKNKMNLSNMIQIYCNSDERSVTFRYTERASMMQIQIPETSVYNTFNNYMDYIEKKGLCMPHEETLDLLYDILDKVKNDTL